MDLRNSLYSNLGYIWNSKDEVIWNNFLGLYWKEINRRPALEVSVEKRMESLTFNEFKDFSEKEFFSFLHDEYYVWKFDTRWRGMNQKRLSVGEKGGKKINLKEIHLQIINLDPQETEKGIRTVIQIPGLSISGASGLLSLIYPEYFGTVDRFVVEALVLLEDNFCDSVKQELERINPNNINIRQAVFMINIMKQKAGQLNKIFGNSNWTARKMDQVLWTHNSLK